MKRKHVIVEGGLDSDSEEECDIDIGIAIDDQNRGQRTRDIHVSRTKRKRADSLPASLPTFKPPSPLLPEKKRYQVFSFFFVFCFVFFG
jgi:hypothetical protein